MLMDSATVKNVTLDGGFIRGKGAVGAFVGESAGTLLNCHSSVEMRTRDDDDARDALGGLVGENTVTGKILNCSSYNHADSDGWSC